MLLRDLEALQVQLWPVVQESYLGLKPAKFGERRAEALPWQQVSKFAGSDIPIALCQWLEIIHELLRIALTLRLDSTPKSCSWTTARQRLG
jgi:hypothetical protein